MAGEVSLDQVLWRRLAATHATTRLPPGSVAEAAHGGLQDTAPRAAVVALHARLEGVEIGTWAHPDLVQVWFRGGASYVVPRADVGVFTLGCAPRDPDVRERLERLADAVHALLPEGHADHRIVEAGLGDRGHPGVLRAVASTGRVHIRWDTQNTELLAVERPDLDPEEARRELARRFVRWLGPVTKQQLAKWVGVSVSDANETWAALDLAPVTVAGRARHVLAEDLELLHAATRPTGVRLLPMGDPVLWAGADVPAPPALALDGAAGITPRLRNSLLGRVLVDGEVVASWGRNRGSVTVHAWPGFPAGRQADVGAAAHELVAMLGYPFHLRWLPA